MARHRSTASPLPQAERKVAAGLSDLLAIKEAAGRDQDLEDVISRGPGKRATARA